MKKRALLLSLLTLFLSETIAMALDTPWQLELITPMAEILEPEILLFLGSVFLVIAVFSKRTDKK